MSVEGISSRISAGLAEAAGAAHSAAGAKGVFMGHAVRPADSPLSLLADAAEEIGFAVDRTKDYELARRKERESSVSSRKMLEQYRRLLEATGGSEAMQAFADRLKRLHDAEDMRRALDEAFQDPTDAWAALAGAGEVFARDAEISEKQKAALRAAQDSFLAQKGEAARLGLQGALTQAGFPEIGGAAAGRDLYRSAVGEFSSVNEVFSEIQSKYGADFDRAMDFLYAALSADLSSDEPSMEKTHLESVHHKLGLVQLAKSAYVICEDVMNRWSEVHGAKRCSLSAMDLLGGLLALRGRSFVSAGDFDRIAQKAAPPDIEREVLFRQDLLAGIKRFPTALFDDEQGFLKVADACQASLDAAIEREDEWLADQ